MKFIALEKENEGLTKKDFESFLYEEAQHVYNLYSQGIIREIYFRGDRNEAVLVMECSSTNEAKEILAIFPLVREKLITFELIPLVSYTGFERLFNINEKLNTVVGENKDESKSNQ